MSGNGRSTPPVPHNYRCLNCGRLLFTAILVPGCKIATRCPKCSKVLQIEHMTASIMPPEMAIEDVLLPV